MNTKILFLSITIFSPDFYQLATLAHQNHSFLCKILTNFSPIKHAYDVKSPYFVEKNHIYLIKSFFCLLLHPMYKSLEVNRKVPTLVVSLLYSSKLGNGYTQSGLIINDAKSH